MPHTLNPPAILNDEAIAKADGLRASGLKATLPRLKILEIFQTGHTLPGTAAKRHMSAEDVYKLLLNEGSDIGLATVYRVLQQFADAGLLKRHHFDEGKAVFELDEGSHHDHLVCLDCGRVEEFYDAEIESRQKLVAQQRGFSLQEHSLALYASCTKAACPNRG
jgi:Fur family transcriptional regulator, ferric uptake regulator